MTAGIIIQALMLLLFLALGIVFALGRGQKLIAGYNTMSEKERARYDEKKLLRVIRNGMFAFAGCMALSLAGILLERELLITTGYVLLVVIAIVLVVRANTAARK